MCEENEEVITLLMLHGIPNAINCIVNRWIKMFVESLEIAYCDII